MPDHIRHVVAFSAKDAKDIPAIKEGLGVLGKIPGVLHFSVSDNLKLDQGSADMDVVLYAEFASTEALEAFKQHEIYAQCIQVVRPLRDQRVVLDTPIK